MTRGGLSGITAYWAIRAMVRDSPEDFIARIESGLDEETARGLRNGMTAIHDVVLLQKVAFLAFLLGCGSILVSIFAIRWLEAVGDYLFEAGRVLWLLAGVIFLGSLIVHAARYRDVHRVEAFVEAMRRSSLARDLA